MSDDDDLHRPHLVAINGEGKGENDPGPEEAPEGANDEALRIRLKQLEQEHRDLDMAIESLEERMPYDRLTIQRFKKKKLALKDEIIRIHDKLLPDIIA